MIAVLLLPACISGRRPDGESSYRPDHPIGPASSLVADSGPPDILDPAEEAEAWAAIEDLFDPRFPVYTRAAARLIDLGEPVLPYLVAVGRRERVDVGIGGQATAPIIYRILADLPSERLVAYLRSPYQDLRVAAVRHLAGRKEPGAVPHLLTTLATDSPELRRRSFDALREITSIPADRPEDWEDEAPSLVPAWQDWWRQRDPLAPVSRIQ